ncbi:MULTISPECIES: glycosyltransferase family 4 protein [unclassified Haladaptatus]|uniref:glycosyltransferase family 4 protein n=1 Tax=unclassified Haladaptatus TaxID=2622732 RepID=UPI0023E80B3E|nr:MULTISPECIES: glycosyltransferase family 4 protein [unclassified Haladaptatus]
MSVSDMGSVEVLVVGPASKETGGIARYIAAQVSYLPRTVRTRVYDVAPASDGTGAWWLTKEVFRAGLRAVRFPFQSRPDVVHVHTSHWRSFYLSSWFVLVASYLWRRPVVLHVHGSEFDDFVERASRPSRLLLSRVFAAAAAVVVLSAYWRDVLRPVAGTTPLLVLPNAVDPDEYDPHFDVTPPHVAFVSNHVPRKGLREFVDAVTACKREGLDFRVTIAGRGPLSHFAEALAETTPDVTYRGFVSEAAKRDLLAESSIYVLPTHAEGLPIAILEAMAGGNAIISTPVGSIPELVGAEGGILVQPGDGEELAAALGSLVAAPETVRQMAETNRRLVEQEYTWQGVAANLTALYAGLAGGQPVGETTETDPLVVE